MGGVTTLALAVILDEKLSLLYLGGLLAFDPLVGGYRVRSPLAARVVAEQCSPGPASIYGLDDAIHARTTYVLYAIATLELQLRARVAKTDVSAAIQRISVSMPGPSGKELKRDLAQLKLSPEVFQGVAKAVDLRYPEKRALTDVLTLRTKKPVPTSAQEILEILTLTELTLVAEQEGIVNAAETQTLGQVVELRNDVAHFRGISLDVMLDISTTVRKLIKKLHQRVEGMTS